MQRLFLTKNLTNKLTPHQAQAFKACGNKTIQNYTINRFDYSHQPNLEYCSSSKRTFFNNNNNLENFKEKLNSFLTENEYFNRHRQQEFILAPIILQSQENDPNKDDKNNKDSENIFGKFLKKTKDKKTPASSQNDSSDKEKKASKNEDDGDKSDEEIGDQDKKEEEKSKKKAALDTSTLKGQIKNLFLNQPGGGPDWYSLAYFLVLLGSVGIMVKQSANQQSYSKEVTYVDFINEYLAKNRIKLVTIGSNEQNQLLKYRVDVELTDGEYVHLNLAQIDNFQAKLHIAQQEMGKSNSEQVPIKYKSQSNENDYVFAAQMGMLLSFFALIYRANHTKKLPPKGSTKSASKGSGGFGGGFMDGMMGQQKQVNVQIYGVDKKIKTKFRHVAGNENAKKEIMEFVDFLKDPSKYKKLGAKVPRGAMMVGPPGTGKTLLAKAVAGEAGVPFLTVSGSDFVEMFVGLGASRVRELFKKAKEHPKAIIFIDEIDAVGKKRHGRMGGNDESDNTLNQLLVEMDGFTTDENIIVLAATNNAEILDNALTRPGRFDRTIDVTLPSIEERKQIYNVHLKKIKLNPEITREEYAAKLSTLTPGFSGADIANICNEAAIISARGNLDNVSIKQFELATERVIAGLERKNIMSKEERKTVAYHEAGHAVAGWFLEHSSPLLKVTIIPRSKGSLGFAQYLPEEVSLYTTEQLEDQVKVALGGRVSEEIFFNKITTGASDDIRKVTQIIQGLVKVYGMNDQIGLRSFQDDPNDFISVKPYSDYTNELIDAECEKLVKDMYQQTKDLLESKKDLIHSLAEKLIEKETVNLTDLVDVLGDRPYGINESMKEYLKEMRTREEIEKKEKQDKQDKEEKEAAQETETTNEEEKKTDDAQTQENTKEDASGEKNKQS